MRHFWFCCLILFICRLLAAWIFPTFDDAFITYRYSENLLLGNGLVYNVGEKVLGTTTPAFALIACIPVLAGIDVQNFFVFFNIACDLCSLYLVYKYIFKNNLTGLVVFAVLFSVAPIINRVSTGGMEVNLFLLLSLIGAIWYLYGRKMQAFILLAAIYFIRPEAVILLFLLLIYDWHLTRRMPLKYGSVAALVLIVPITVIYLYYGQALPHSVVAKSSMHRETWSNLLKWTVFADPMFFVFTPLAVAGIFHQLPKSGLRFVLAVWAAIYTAAYFIAAPPMYTWYGYSIQFVVLLLAAFPIARILAKMNIRYYEYALPLAAVLVWVAIAFYKGRSGVEKHVYAVLCKDFRSDSAIKGKVIYADDIGAIGYFTGAYIYDGLALVTPSALNHTTQTAKMTASRADYLFIYANSKFLHMVLDDPFLSANYTVIKRYSPDGKTELPSGDSSGGWTYAQDYLLLRKTGVKNSSSALWEQPANTTAKPQTHTIHTIPHPAP